LSKLPLNQKAEPLLDQILSPARSLREVFETLDRSYQNKATPAVWFLTAQEPFFRTSNETPRPAKDVKRCWKSLDHQYARG